MLDNKARIFFLLIGLVFFSEAVFAEDADDASLASWRNIESKYCTILTHPKVNIEKVTKKIKINFYDVSPSKYALKSNTPSDGLAKKVDQLFGKVEKILDMYPRKMHVSIEIFKNQDQLDALYRSIFPGTSKRELSFYIHKKTTIYTTEQAISHGLLAHEMAHAVIDHYFLILPPEKIKELLSQYVELHLED